MHVNGNEYESLERRKKKNTGNDGGGKTEVLNLPQKLAINTKLLIE